MKLFERFASWVVKKAQSRPPNFVVGPREVPYLRRWWVIPRNPVFNIFVHQFLASDDDRALHDHPWWSWSLLLKGTYVEHTIEEGGIHLRITYTPGSFHFRRGRFAHRIEIVPHKHPCCWTLFITGPRYREWGFHCPEQGWVHWKRFTSPADKGQIGAGCDG